MPTTLATPTHIFPSASSSMVDLLLEPIRAPDLSGLTHLRCAESTNERLNVLLGRIGATLTHLHVTGHDRMLDDLNPTFFPALTQIDVFITAPPFNRFLACLPTENRIATINVNVIPTSLAIDKDFESVLLRRPMPVLKSVNVVDPAQGSNKTPEVP
ncbi:hypothetical protein MVEN_01992900 [Mycena venus]|uniref:Uncharacterized protein n=1 Tax=Mycena venus TaxID=2733690 RepID=A0A8H6XDL6_9AGAR|nr:hypothetical protein MVEN_01992900 [Mycena venus]